MYSPQAYVVIPNLCRGGGAGSFPEPSPGRCIHCKSDQGETLIAYYMDISILCRLMKSMAALGQVPIHFSVLKPLHRYWRRAVCPSE
jgi:hypothetical protein